MSTGAKLLIFGSIFVIGSIYIIMTYSSGIPIPGLIMVIAAGPPAYYYYAKYRSNFKYQTDAEILSQAKKTIKK